MRYLYGGLFLIVWLSVIAPVTSEAAPIVSGSFSTTWQTDNPGISADNQIQFRLGGGGDTCTGTVYWEEVGNDTNNGSSTLNSSCNVETITFPVAGTYRVDILGAHPRFYPYSTGPYTYDARKLLSVEQWGSNVWSSMEGMFGATEGLIFNASDAPNLSSVSSMAYMFSGALNFNEPLNNWDVSNVTNMRDMFAFADTFNGDVSNWNVGSVTDMSSMFRDAAAFNQPLDGWNVSNVTQMQWMFWGAASFNQPLNNWVVSNVTQFGGYSGPYDNSGMFAGAVAFNQPLDNWDVSGATIMSGMFNGATSFNQDISMWDVSNVFYMRNMFEGATAFNQPLNSWTVSIATNMWAMFAGATSFNQSLASWNVGNVTLMLDMFSGATSFNQPLGMWNITNVTDMGAMLSNSGLSVANYSATLNDWSLQVVENNVVLGAANLYYFDTASTARQSLITNNSWTISDGGQFVQPPNHVFVTRWDTRLDPSTSNQLRIRAVGGSSYNFFIDWGDGTTRYYGATPGGYLSHTYSTPGIKTVTITGLFPSFTAGGFDADTDKLIDISQWGTMPWEELYFSDTNYLTSFSASDTPDLSLVTDMNGMFFGATQFNGNINNWDVSNVTNMQSMFYGASSFNQPLNNWDVSNVTLFGPDGEGSGMFQNATAFNQSLNNWNITSATIMDDMFNGSGLSRENYSDTLIGWAEQSVQPGVTLGAVGIAYLDIATTARETLTDTFGWTINDSGLFMQPINNQFITVWDTSLDAGTPNELYLELYGGSAANFFLDWGDGTVQYYSDFPGSLTHVYATSGPKTVTITGTFPYYYVGCDYGPEYNKLVDVLSWGTEPWEYINFNDCNYLDDFTATNTPNLSLMTDMSSMFYSTPFNDDISDWDVSNVTNMLEMFRQANDFNQNLASWNITNVTDVGDMFRNTALSTSNYSKILLGWSQLTLGDGLNLGTVGMNGSETPYCSSVQPARDIITTTYSWSINDGGSVTCKTVTYLTVADATLLGDTFQYVEDGEDGTAVTVVPADGYRFVRWSDGSTENPRMDDDLTTDISVTAIVELSSSARGSATRIGARAERLKEMILNNPIVVSITTFVKSVRDFLDYLTDNEAEIEKLPAEERTKVIIALRDIIVFLLTLIPGA